MTASYAPSLYPGTVRASQAETVDLHIGETRTDVDIPLEMVPTTKLDVQIVDPAGQPPTTVIGGLLWPGHALGLTEKNYIGRAPSNLGLAVQDAHFVRSALVPGRYTIFARAASSSARSSGSHSGEPVLDLWAIHELDINGEPTRDVVVVLQPGMRVAGRAAVPPGASVDGLRFALTPAPGEFNLPVSPVAVSPEGTFEFEGVAPGEYQLDVTGAKTASLAIASIVEAGREIVDATIIVRPDLDHADVRVTLTELRRSLSGRLLDGLGRPAPEFVIVVFSTDRSMWRPGSRRTRLARPATDGTYSFEGLLPGEYLVAAVTEVEPWDLDDADFLALLESSSHRLVISPLGQQTLDLQIAGVPNR
jgi:hypothetical protein